MKKINKTILVLALTFVIPYSMAGLFYAIWRKIKNNPWFDPVACLYVYSDAVGILILSLRSLDYKGEKIGKTIASIGIVRMLTWKNRQEC